MTAADEPDLVARKVVAQVDLLLQAFPEARCHPDNWREEGVDYLYRWQHLLVRDDDVARVNEIVPGQVVRSRASREQVQRGDSRGGGVIGPEYHPPGLSLFQVSTDEPLPDLLERVDSVLGPGVAVPDHLLFVVGHASHCPASEPEPEAADAKPIPEACSGDGGTNVLVHILDSGWFPGSDTRHSWLAGVDGDTEDTYFPAGHAKAGQIMPYSGHGTFCAGVLRSIAPKTEVYVEKTFYGAGGAFESDIAAQVQRALSLGADLFSLSAGCYSRADIPLLGFDVVLDLIAQHKGVLLVAAAGNDNTRQPFWPAAAPGVLAVGALNTDGTDRAYFSNYGGWVDVYAPGQDLVNAFATGDFTYVEPPYDQQARTEEFTGMARWSGTSFSTPLVAGLIADRMYQTGENAQTAAAALVAQAQSQAIPGVGAVLP